VTLSYVTGDDVRYVMSLNYWTDSQTSHTETN